MMVKNKRFLKDIAYSFLLLLVLAEGKATEFINNEELTPFSGKIWKKEEGLNNQIMNPTYCEIELQQDQAQNIASQNPAVIISHLDVLKELKKKRLPLENKKPATNLNEVAQKIYATPTGAYLKYLYPNDDLEQSVSKAVMILLERIKENSQGDRCIASENILNALKNDFSTVHKEVTTLVSTILINSVAEEDYYTFYHGHGNSLRLYMDMLREVKSYETIMDLTFTNPMRDKTSKTSVRTVTDVLSKYEEEAEKYAAENNISLFNKERVLGVGFAPDKIDFMRSHAIAANINLFGNIHTLGECTLFYFIDSFSISNPNETLITNLIKRLSDPHITPEALKAKVKRYTDLYEQYMAHTGGNLIEIKIKKGKFGKGKVRSVDDMAFPSWMKGIPIWVDKVSKTLATCSNNYDAVPILRAEHEQYERPTMGAYWELMVKDPEAFIRTYSNFSKNNEVTKKSKIESLERPQARLIIDPQTFNKNVKVKQYTRVPVPEEQIKKYQVELQKLIREDLKEYVFLIQKEVIKVPAKDRLQTLITYPYNKGP